MPLSRIGAPIIAGVAALCLLTPLRALSTPHFPTARLSAGWNLVSGSVVYFAQSDGSLYTFGGSGPEYTAAGRSQLQTFAGYWLHADQAQQISLYSPISGRAGDAEINAEPSALCGDAQGPRPCWEACSLPGSQQPQVACAIGRAPHTMPVQQGWSLIGNGFDQPIAIVGTDITVYTYDPSSRQYEQTDTLQPHQGALVRAEHDATLAESGIP